MAATVKKYNVRAWYDRSSHPDPRIVFELFPVEGGDGTNAPTFDQVKDGIESFLLGFGQIDEVEIVRYDEVTTTL